MKILLGILIAVSSTMALAQTPGVSCTYRMAGDVQVSMCSMPDGSGVETYLDSATASEDHYTPEQWTARLKTVAEADAKYGEDVRKIRTHIEAMNTAARITGKKACKAAGNRWIGGACMAPTE